MKLKKFINEISDTSIDYAKSDVTTPYIQEIIKDISKATGKSIKDIIDELSKKSDKIKSMMINDPLNKDILNNTVESAIFDMIPKKVYENEDFNLDTLNDMFDQFKAGFSSMFPLKNGGDGKFVSPSLLITPAESFIQLPSWATGVDTAAAAPDGTIVFNKDFAQKLMYFGRKKGIKVPYKMFQSNGGDIPNDYGYILFLIAHEVMHILHGDSFITQNRLIDFIEKNKSKYSDIIKQYGNNIPALSSYVQNIVGDFISNHELLKMGLPQLPVGLYSEDVNYDSTETMEEMWKKVLSTMNKQAKNNSQANQEYNKQSDDHIGNNDQDSKQNNGASNSQPNQNQSGQPENQSGQSGQSGQPGNQSGQSGQPGNQSGQPGNQSGQSGQPGNQPGNQSGQPGDQSGQPGNQSGQSGQPGNQPGNQSGQPGNQSDSQNQQKDINSSTTNKDLDNNYKNTQKAIKEAAKKLKSQDKQQVQKELDKLSKIEDKKTREEIAKKINTSKSNDFDIKFDDTYNAKFTWKQIIKRMIPSDDKEKNSSYTKISKRNSAGLLQLKQKGISAAKPGIVETQGNKKDLLLVIDNSGSVMSGLSKINKELFNIINKHSKDLANMFIIKFDTNFSMFTIDIKSKKFTKIQNPKSILQSKGDFKKIKMQGNPKDIKTLFTTSDMGGGTDFSTELTQIITIMLKKDTNCILFSDSDILWDENKKNLNKLMLKFGKIPFKFNIIMNSKYDFNTFISKFKAYKYLSYILG